MATYPNDAVELVNAIALAIDEKFGGSGVSPTLDGQYPDDVCKALANIKTAIDNFGEGTPSSEHYPDDLCKALANVESKICSAQAGGGGAEVFEGVVTLLNKSGNASYFSLPRRIELDDGTVDGLGIHYLTNNGSVRAPYAGQYGAPDKHRALLINGNICVASTRAFGNSTSVTNGTVVFMGTFDNNAGGVGGYCIVVKPKASNSIVTIEIH